jgi:hypothetical protein
VKSLQTFHGSKPFRTVAASRWRVHCDRKVLPGLYVGSATYEYFLKNAQPTLGRSIREVRVLAQGVDAE